MNYPQLYRLRASRTAQRSDTEQYGTWCSADGRDRPRRAVPGRAGPDRLDVSRRRRLPTDRTTDEERYADDDHWLNVRRRTGCMTWSPAGERTSSVDGKLMSCGCRPSPVRLKRPRSVVSSDVLHAVKHSKKPADETPQQQHSSMRLILSAF